MFESKWEPLAPKHVFARRLAFSFLVMLITVAITLVIGACGYHTFAGLTWLDATLNAAMILTGMGPVDPMKTPAAKVFATFYCLFSGIVVLSLTGVLLAPIYHRFLHKFSIATEEDEESDNSDPGSPQGDGGAPPKRRRHAKGR